MIVIIGILVLAALILMFSACGMCCVLFGGKDRLRKKYERMQPTGPVEKYFAWFLFFLPMFVIGLSIAAHIGGVNYFSNGLYAVEDSSVAMINHSSQLIGNASITLGKIVDNIKVSLNNAVDTTVGSVNLNQLDSTVIVSLSNLVTGFNDTKTQVAALKVTRDTLVTNINTLKTDATALVTSKNWLI